MMKKRVATQNAWLMCSAKFASGAKMAPKRSCALQGLNGKPLLCKELPTRRECIKFSKINAVCIAVVVVIVVVVIDVAVVVIDVAAVGIDFVLLLL